jgi:hypothetical protein
MVYGGVPETNCEHTPAFTSCPQITTVALLLVAFTVTFRPSKKLHWHDADDVSKHPLDVERPEPGGEMTSQVKHSLTADAPQNTAVRFGTAIRGQLSVLLAKPAFYNKRISHFFFSHFFPFSPADSTETQGRKEASRSTEARTQPEEVCCPRPSRRTDKWQRGSQCRPPQA